MKIILLGAPGAGKGTQAVKIAAKFNAAHVSTGDLLRKNIKEGTELGKKAKEYMDAGRLVPDELVIALVADVIKDADSFLLDGFPRTIEQAKAVDRITEIEKVLNLQIDETLLMDRLTGRRVCKECAAVTHITLLNGADKCALCGGSLYQRSDDNETTVKSRMEAYYKQTAPLIEYYEKQNKLINVNSGRDSADVFKDIEKILMQRSVNRVSAAEKKYN
ncbi:MAG: adenylate kinase [Clostridiales bacterium]|jgi:adenylate kinase|nr:adenylate kinase [Clostridiales bacterium]